MKEAQESRPAEQQEALQETTVSPPQEPEEKPAQTAQAPQQDTPQKHKFGLGKRLARLFGGGRKLDAETLEELEILLLQSDVGVPTTQAILEELAKHPKSAGSGPLAALEEIVTHRLVSRQVKLLPARPDGKLHILLVVGSNGSGKTTTIAKLAHFYQQAGYQPLLAAGDTFRAAAIEQLRYWGDSLAAPVVAHKQGGDSAAVIYDAVNAAAARGNDLVLADTAGRLHNKQQLLDELDKIYRTATKTGSEHLMHAVLILDAATGASAIPMVRMFAEAVPITGLIVTKLDGSAKGGSVLALADALPIAFLGLGERLADLQPFTATDYAKRLVG